MHLCFSGTTLAGNVLHGLLAFWKDFRRQSWLELIERFNYPFRSRVKQQRLLWVASRSNSQGSFELQWPLRGLGAQKRRYVTAQQAQGKAFHCALWAPFTQDAHAQLKQMGPVVVNGSVHTARKQHQRICVRICVRIASRVLCEWGLTPVMVWTVNKTRLPLFHASVRVQLSSTFSGHLAIIPLSEIKIVPNNLSRCTEVMGNQTHCLQLDYHLFFVRLKCTQDVFGVSWMWKWGPIRLFWPRLVKHNIRRISSFGLTCAFVCRGMVHVWWRQRPFCASGRHSQIVRRRYVPFVFTRTLVSIKTFSFNLETSPSNVPVLGDWHCAYVLLYGPRILKIDTSENGTESKSESAATEETKSSTDSQPMETS